MKENKILFAVVALCLLGVLMIYSSSYIWADYKYGNPYKYVINQSVFLVLGFIVLKTISKIDYKIYKTKANAIIAICFLLLVLVLIPGIGVIRNGSRSWFGIGPFGIQPSEICKIGLTIFVAKYLAKNNRDKKHVKKFTFPILAVIMAFFGLIMLEPDFGTGMVIVVFLVILIFISGTKVSLFVKIGILGLLGIAGLIIIAPYRLSRIISFLNPWSDPLGSGFQIIQSLFAIGPGGLLGLGLFNSRQKHFYLPEPQTDFIFAIICEELGIIGAALIIGLFLLIIINSLKVAIETDDLFGKYLAFGFTFSLAFQTMLNLMVVVGLVPVTGVTLPFLSYGGSSLLVSLSSIGIILNVSKSNKKKR